MSRPLLSVPALLALLAAPAAAAAAPAAGPPDSVATAHARLAPSSAGGFLFHVPIGFVALRAGANFARANSDVFQEWGQRLTLDRGDFTSASFGADVGFRLVPRLDGVLSLGVSHASHWSEYRDFEEEVNGVDQPIRQQTELTQVPLSASLRFSLLPEGRSIGQLAWVPARMVPFVGAGGGVVYYRFEQSGDFVDEGSTDPLGPPIFSDNLRSDGWGPSAHVFGGVDVALGPRLGLTAQARYTWASAGMDQHAYDGYNDIDLSGLQTTVGLTVRF